MINQYMGVAPSTLQVVYRYTCLFLNNLCRIIFGGEGGGVGKDVFAVWKSLVGIVGSMMRSFRPKTHRINGWN